MILVNSIEELQDKIQKYHYTNYMTNNYLMIDSYKLLIEGKNLFFETINDNLFLYEYKGDFFKVYYYINNSNVFEKTYIPKPQILEILFRGKDNEPIEEIGILEKMGFTKHLRRNMLTARYDGLKDISKNNNTVNVKLADNDDEIKYTKNIFDRTFDKYTGNILSLEEIKNSASNKCLICAFSENEFSGALQYYIKNNIAWIGHIAVSENFRGQGIAQHLVNYYISINKSIITRFNLWVLSDNKPAIKLYDNFGFKYAGKSTISMIKYN